MDSRGGWNRGKTNIYSQETLLKMSKAKIGRKDSPETIEKKRIAQICRYENIEERNKVGIRIKKLWENKNHREKMSRIKKGNTINIGRIASIETRRKMSEAQKGSKSWNWQGGNSPSPYPIEFSSTLREKIRQRDKYLCLLCGKKQQKRKHSVHHVDYDKNNNIEINLTTTCVMCHTKTNGYRDEWQHVIQANVREMQP